MKKLLSSVSSLFVLFLFSACQGKNVPLSHQIKPGCQYYSLKSAQCLNKKQLLQKLEPYKVIFIGDHHTEDDLHKNIANLITSLSQQGFTIHLANEWFYPHDARTLEAFARRDINETEFIKNIEWKKRLKHYHYKSFEPMYEAIRESRGGLYGINLSKTQKKNISEQNLSAMNTEELTFNNSLDLDVRPHQKLVMPYLKRCHAPKKDESLQACIKRMYRVQVSWDSKMAEESYKLSKNLKKDEKLLIFAGSMHIQDHLGIPLRFARLSNLPTVSIIPANSQTTEVNNGFGDYLLYYREKEPNK